MTICRRRQPEQRVRDDAVVGCEWSYFLRKNQQHGDEQHRTLLRLAGSYYSVVVGVGRDPRGRLRHYHQEKGVKFLNSEYNTG